MTLETTRIYSVAVGMLVLLCAGCKSLPTKMSLPHFAAAKAEPVDLKPSSEPSQEIDVQQSQIDLLMALAENHESHGDLAAAAGAYEQVLTKEAYGPAKHSLALVSVKLGDEQRALSLLNECLAENPDDAELIADAAYVTYLCGQWEEAEKLTRRGLAIDPRSARLHNNLGLILARCDRIDEAVKAFELAGCSRAEAYCNLGNAFYVYGEPDRGEHFLRLATAESPPSQRAADMLQRIVARQNSALTR